MGAPERLNPRLDGTNTHLQIARLKDILARLDERAAALMVPGAFRKKLEAAGGQGTHGPGVPRFFVGPCVRAGEGKKRKRKGKFTSVRYIYTLRQREPSEDNRDVDDVPLSRVSYYIYMYMSSYPSSSSSSSPCLPTLRRPPRPCRCGLKWRVRASRIRSSAVSTT